MEVKSFSRVQLFETPWTVQFMEFPRPEYWSGSPFPSPEGLPNPGVEPRSPILQVDFLPAEPQGKPKNTGVGSLSLLQGSSLPRNQTGVSCIAGRFFTSWVTRESPDNTARVYSIFYYVLMFPFRVSLSSIQFDSFFFIVCPMWFPSETKAWQ